jgi:2-polyprenyl-3-methyl-5-hydroxy-6-metoxy-1,4-benzoquinol methylase
MCPLFDILPFINDDADSILDLGCDNGLLLYFCYKLKHIKNAIGIDINEKLLNIVNNNFSKFNNINYKFLTIKNPTQWPEDSFNIVSMIDILHYLNKNNHIIFFKEAAKRVKNNGIFIVKDMLNHPIFYGLTNTINDMIFSRQIPNYPDLDSLINEISDDFKVIFDKKSRLLWYMHRQIVFQKK